ncbi:hypothetical protein E2C01_068913 [Portunus trituberculatus]|uniref:Uncharacterized protein n=1 Tax=Portunus trituberculatus TaxID=210409 RepID=A0A5B7HQ34_PORTR|nr:hypothetical protein [Portunus trituberculatus]
MVVHAAVGALWLRPRSLPFQCLDALADRVQLGAHPTLLPPMPAAPGNMAVALAPIAPCWLLHVLADVELAQPAEVQRVWEPVHLEEDLHAPCWQPPPGRLDGAVASTHH